MVAAHDLSSGDAVTFDNVSVTLAENLKVIAPSAHGAGANPYSVALLVTPEESEKLHLASELGSLSLSLRAPNDDSARDGGRATIHTLIGGEAAKNVK